MIGPAEMQCISILAVIIGLLLGGAFILSVRAVRGEPAALPDAAPDFLPETPVFKDAE